MTLQTLLNFGLPGLFVDFHGTLSSSRFWTNLGSRAMTRRAEYEIFRQRPELVEEWMIGQVSAEEVHRILASELNVDFEWLWSRFLSQSKRIRLSGLQELNQLRQRFRIAIVTVNVDTFSRYSARSKRLEQFVDAVVNSADLNAMKHSEANSIFHIASSVLGCQLSNSLLLDDSPDSCKQFSVLGGYAIRVSSVAQCLTLLHELQIASVELQTTSIQQFVDYFQHRSSYLFSDCGLQLFPPIDVEPSEHADSA